MATVASLAQNSLSGPRFEIKLTEPVVDPHVGEEVPDKHVGGAELLAEVHQNGDGAGNTNVAHDDSPGITVLIQRAAGIEMVDPAAETVLLALATALSVPLVVVVSGNVGEEVVPPADGLLANQVDQSNDGSLLGELMKLMDHLAEAGGLLLAGAGKENHVALHVAGGLVVLAVAQLPAVVGDQESRVKEPAGHVADSLGSGEGTVAALVGKDPDAGTEETLEESVDTPEDHAGSLVGDVLGGHKVVPEVEGGGQKSNVTGDIAEAAEVGPLEAVLGNGIADLLDGEVGDLELVSVSVDELAVILLGSRGVSRGKRRKRGRRGRVTGRIGGGGGVARDGRVAVDSLSLRGVLLGSNAGRLSSSHGEGCRTSNWTNWRRWMLRKNSSG